MVRTLKEMMPSFSVAARKYAYETETDGGSDPTWFDLYEGKLAELIVEFLTGEKNEE